MGFGGSGGRLVELGERKRGAQTPTAGALLFRDGDGALEDFLRGRGVSRVALEQDFGARPMQFGFERPMAQAARIGEQGAMHRLELVVKDEVAFWKRFEERGEDVA